MKRILIGIAIVLFVVPALFWSLHWPWLFLVWIAVAYCIYTRGGKSKDPAGRAND
jgi:hypothetical protein